MVKQDDRSPAEKRSHEWLVVGTDSFLSGWGRAVGGKSYTAWACRFNDLDKVQSWVRSRSDMTRVRACYHGWNPKGVGHAHVYVVNDGHPALGGK